MHLVSRYMRVRYEHLATSPLSVVAATLRFLEQEVQEEHRRQVGEEGTKE